MAQYLPPTQNVAIFDSINFNAGSDALTYNDALKYFLRYPYAQGDNILQNVSVAGVLTGSKSLYSPITGGTGNNIIGIGNISFSGGSPVYGTNYISMTDTGNCIMSGNLTFSQGLSTKVLMNGNITGTGAYQVLNSDLANISGTTSNIQTQLNNKAGLGSNTFSGTQTAPNFVLTLGGGGSITFADGTIQSTAGGGGGASLTADNTWTGQNIFFPTINTKNIVAKNVALSTALTINNRTTAATETSFPLLVSMYDNNSGNYPSIIFSDSNITTQTGYQNIIFGYKSGSALTSGIKNTLIGTKNGSIITSGSRNILLGDTNCNIASTITTQNDNVIVGNNINTNGNQNVFLGSTSGSPSIKTGDGSVMIGFDAGYKSTSGTGLTLMGFQSGNNLTTGSNLTYIGYQSGLASTTATQCTFIGYQAGSGLTTGANCTIIGYQAGNTITGDANTIIGSRGATKLTTGTQNIAVGNETMGGANGIASSASNSVYLGAQCGGYNASSSFAVAIGWRALWNCNSNYQIAIGYQASGSNITGIANCIVGSFQGVITTGVKNIIIGNVTQVSDSAGFTSGSYNISIGSESSKGLTSGSNNVVIGRDICTVTNTGSNLVAIGNGACKVATVGDMVAIGTSAGLTLTSGSKNTFVGTESGTAFTNTNNNACFGYRAGYTATGANNTLIGALTGNQNNSTAVDNNTFIGYNVLPTINGGTGNNIAIGANTLSNALITSVLPQNSIFIGCGDGRTFGLSIPVNDNPDGLMVIGNNRHLNYQLPGMSNIASSILVNSNKTLTASNAGKVLMLRPTAGTYTVTLPQIGLYSVPTETRAQYLRNAGNLFTLVNESFDYGTPYNITIAIEQTGGFDASNFFAGYLINSTNNISTLGYATSFTLYPGDTVVINTSFQNSDAVYTITQPFGIGNTDNYLLNSTITVAGSQSSPAYAYPFTSSSFALATGSTYGFYNVSRLPITFDTSGYFTNTSTYGMTLNVSVSGTFTNSHSNGNNIFKIRLYNASNASAVNSYGGETVTIGSAWNNTYYMQMSTIFYLYPGYKFRIEMVNYTNANSVFTYTAGSNDYMSISITKVR